MSRCSLDINLTTQVVTRHWEDSRRRASRTVFGMLDQCAKDDLLPPVPSPSFHRRHFHCLVHPFELGAVNKTIITIIQFVLIYELTSALNLLDASCSESSRADEHKLSISSIKIVDGA